MPKRLLDSSLFTSPSLARLSPRAQDAFPRFILCADDFGCFDANPRALVGLAWPLRTDVTEADVEGWLGELVAAGMAQLWEEGGRRYCCLLGWTGPHGQRQREEYDRKKSPHGASARPRGLPVPRLPAPLPRIPRAGTRRETTSQRPGNSPPRARPIPVPFPRPQA